MHGRAWRRSDVRGASCQRRLAAITIAVVGTTAGLGGCGQGDQPPPPVASSASASASGSGSSSAAKAPRKAPPTWAPLLWEAAYQRAKGREPPRPIVEEAVPEVVPPCANRSGRVFLREKFKDEYARQVVATDRQNEERRREADKQWLPKQQEWLKAATALAATLKAGVFPAKVAGAAMLSQYGAAGSKSPIAAISFDEGPGVEAFRDALAKTPGWDAPFRCQILGAKRTVRAASPKTKAALQGQKAGGGGTVAIDQITCEEISGPPLRIVVEVPGVVAKAKVTVADGSATIGGYEVVERPGLDPKLAAALEGGGTYALAGAVIEVGGVGKLARAEHGALAFAMLQDRGMEMQLAVKSAEHKNVWVASFDRACSDEGLGCTYGDGRAAPSVKYIADSVPTDVERAAPAADDAYELPPPSEQLGCWERAARAADPSIVDDPASLHEEPWRHGLFPRLVENAKRPESYGDVGGRMSLDPPDADVGPILAKFRAALVEAGGMGPFTCEVLDMGEEINSLPIPVVEAALKARGQSLEGAWSWNIVCKGDEKSHLGTVVLYVPSYAAWAKLDKGTIADYHLERYGYFSPELRTMMLDIGKGTLLEVRGAARLLRTETKYVVLGQSWPTPIWRAYLYDWQCPAAGAGCAHLDGLAPPLVTVAPNGLKRCEVTNHVYPPPT